MNWNRLRKLLASFVAIGAVAFTTSGVWADASGSGVDGGAGTVSGVEGETPDPIVVTNVSFRQRYPWNGLVDVSFDVEYIDPATNFTIKLSAKDAVTGKSLMAKHFWLEGDDTHTNKINIVAGSGYHILWDVAADYPDVVCRNLKVSVSASLDARSSAVASGDNGDVRVYATGTDYYLGNDFFEVGINKYGVIGALANAPTYGDIIFHPEDEWSWIGFVTLFDSLVNYSYSGDHMYKEFWRLYEGGYGYDCVAEAKKYRYDSYAEVYGVDDGTFVNNSSASVVDVSVINGCDSDFEIEHNVTFTSDNLGYLMTIRITNKSAVEKTNVRYEHQYDRDLNQTDTDNYYYKDASGNLYLYTFNNYNYTDEQDPERLREIMVEGGTKPFVMVGVASENYTVEPISEDSVSNRFNYHYWDDDVHMGLMFTIPSIAAGETVELYYIGTIDKYVNLTEDDPFGGYGFASVAAKGVSEEGHIDTTTGNRLAEGAELLTYNPAWGDGESVSVYEDSVEITNATVAGEFTWTPSASVGLHTLTHVSGGETLSAGFVVWGDDIVSHSANVNSDEIWGADKVHIVRQPLTVADGVTLTIEPSAVVKFMPGTSLVVESGAICMAQGVVFTHINDDTAGGDTMFDGNMTEPVTGDYSISGYVVDDDDTEYRYMPPQVLQSYIYSDTRLRGYRTYIVSDSVTVERGATLTLLPGTVLKFERGCSLTVNGALDAQGVRAAPIVFTSAKDDVHGGDTNGDGDETYAQAGDWRQIKVTGMATFNYAHVLYCSSIENTGAIDAYGGTVDFDNSVIAHTMYECVNAHSSGYFTARNSVFWDSSLGFGYYGSGRVKAYNCVFADLTVAIRQSGKLLANCVFYRCLDFTDQSGDYSNYKNCCFYNPAGDGAQSYFKVGSDGNVWGDPKFVDVDNGDFRIQSSSVCVDAADSMMAPKCDWYGRQRGSTPDIGIYEFPGGEDVPAADLTVTSVTVPAEFTVGETVDIAWTVKNVGEETADGIWRDEIEIVAANGQTFFMGTVRSQGILRPGTSASFHATLMVPAAPEGDVQVRVTANKYQDIFEAQAVVNNANAAQATLDVPILDVPSDGAATNITIAAGFATGFAFAGAEALAAQGGVLIIRGSGALDAWLGNGSIAAKDNALRTAVKIAEDTWLLQIPKESEPRVTVRNDGESEVAVQLALEMGGFFLLDTGKKSAANSGVVSVPFFGNGFGDALVCWIERGGTQIEATDLRVESGVSALATFDVTGCEAGDWTLHVKKGSEEASATLLTLAEGSVGAKWSCKVNVADTLRSGRVYVGSVEYGNLGDAAMPAPYLHLTANEGTLIRLTEADAWTDSIELMAISDTYPASSLKAGETGTIDFFYKTLGSRATVRCDYTLSSDEVFTWDVNAAYMRPSWATDEMWSLALATLKSNVGATWNDLLDRMRTNSDHLMKIDCAKARLDRLWQMEVNEALGVDLAMQTLASGKDLERSGRGLGLLFLRIYGASLSSRLRNGVFGYGWRDSFSQYAELIDSTTLAIHLPSGSTYQFTKVSGSWKPEDARDKTKLDETAAAYVLTYRDGTVQTIVKSNMRTSSIRDNQGNELVFTYNGNLLTKVSHSDGQSLTFKYSDDKVASVADDQGRTVRYGYTGDLLTSVTAFNGFVTRYAYHSADGTLLSRALTQITNPDGTTKDYTYDSQGRVATVSVNGNQFTTEIVRGLCGSYSVVAPNGGVTEVTVGAKGNVTKIVNALGQTVKQQFSDTGLLEGIIAPSGKRSKMSYNKDGQLVASASASGAETAFAYESDFDNLASVTDAKGHAIRYGYDEFGRDNAISYVDGSSSSLEYNERGDVVKSTNRRGESIAYEYDDEGRLVKKTWPDGRTFTMTYDAKGNVTDAEDSVTGAVTMEYDANERLTKITYPKGRGFTYKYDAVGRMAERASLDGAKECFTYDTFGRLATVTDGDGNAYLTNAYDPTTGWLVTQTYGNGTVVSNAYDILGRTVGIYHLKGGERMAFFEYAYDADGKCISQTTAEGVEKYTYDADGQLIGVIYPDETTESFTYDAVGNRITANGAPYTVNDMNQYSQIGGTAFEYDADGNMTRNGDTHYSYDILNRLVAVTDDVRGIYWSCEYDVFGNRVSVTDNGTMTERVYLQGSLPSVAAEYVDDALVKRHILVGAVRIADVATTPSSSRYYHADLLGSARLLTDGTGEIKGTRSFKAFGETRTFTGETTDAGYVGTLGVETDSNGLIFMRNRYYSSGMGRFMQMDPIGLNAGDVNLYRYCGNATIFLMDMNGLDATACNDARCEYMAREWQEFFKDNPDLKPDKEYWMTGTKRKDKKKILKNTGPIGKLIAWLFY